MCGIRSLCDNRANFVDRQTFMSSQKPIAGLTKKIVYAFTNMFSLHSVMFLQALSDFPIAD